MMSSDCDHLPGESPFRRGQAESTRDSEYRAMRLTTIGSALWFWRAAFATRRAPVEAVLRIVAAAAALIACGGWTGLWGGLRGGAA